MKQIDECLDRALRCQPPLKKKWKAFIGRVRGYTALSLYHYQHLVLVYDLDHDKSMYEWWERPADKRGLYAALEYFEKRRGMLDVKE